MSKTPRTDKLENNHKMDETSSFRECYFESLSLCRQLEEELSRAEKERDEYYSRALSLVFKLPPETLAGDVQKWRDEMLSELIELRKDKKRMDWLDKQFGDTCHWQALFNTAVHPFSLRNTVDSFEKKS